MSLRIDHIPSHLTPFVPWYPIVACALLSSLSGAGEFYLRVPMRGVDTPTRRHSFAVRLVTRNLNPCHTRLATVSRNSM
jgi:hypothetical protein